MTNRLNDESNFPSLSNRLNESGHNFMLDKEVNEHINGITVVVEKRLNYSFVGENPHVYVESDHLVLETQLTSRIVVFIPGFRVGDYINITISGQEKDIESVMVYELLEDPSGENFLVTEIDDN